MKILIAAAGVVVLMLSNVRAQTWTGAAVRVVGIKGSALHHGSGTILGSDGRSGLVLTCRHVVEGAEAVNVYRTGGHGYRAVVLALDRSADLGALLIRDTGDLPTVRVLDLQPKFATLAGYGGGRQLGLVDGRMVARGNRSTVFYSLTPEDGDSGGGLFDSSGHLAGVLWGRSGELGAAVDVVAIRRFFIGIMAECADNETTALVSEYGGTVVPESLAGAVRLRGRK